jgi:hypothetical protein
VSVILPFVWILLRDGLLLWFSSSAMEFLGGRCALTLTHSLFSSAASTCASFSLSYSVTLALPSIFVPHRPIPYPLLHRSSRSTFRTTVRDPSFIYPPTSFSRSYSIPSVLFPTFFLFIHLGTFAFMQSPFFFRLFFTFRPAHPHFRLVPSSLPPHCLDPAPLAFPIIHLTSSRISSFPSSLLPFLSFLLHIECPAAQHYIRLHFLSLPPPIPSHTPRLTHTCIPPPCLLLSPDSPASMSYPFSAHSPPSVSTHHIFPSPSIADTRT